MAYGTGHWSLLVSSRLPGRRGQPDAVNCHNQAATVHVASIKCSSLALHELAEPRPKVSMGQGSATVSRVCHRESTCAQYVGHMVALGSQYAAALLPVVARMARLEEQNGAGEPLDLQLYEEIKSVPKVLPVRSC